MINQELKYIIEDLADTIDDSSLIVSGDTVFTQACLFLLQSKSSMCNPRVKEKNPNRKASEAQIKYFHKFGLGDTENLTAVEAFKKIKYHKEKNK